MFDDLATGIVSGLPTGTVTFFFSDIEGSTKTLQRLGHEFREVLDRHSVIVRSALEDYHGIELGTEGDSFFAVFTTAPDAIGAAIAVDQRLAEADWPDGGTIKVRIGLHSGMGELGGANYGGLDVHRAARISAAGHGGQVVVSEATKVLAFDAEYIDLGTHRLKDLERPEHLYQLIVPGLPDSFPPLRTIDARPNNLPTVASRLIGREEATGQLLESIRSHRVVTLTGPGGVGKTRLAIEVAGEALADFEAGVFFIPLAPVTDPALVLSGIAAELGLDEVRAVEMARALGPEARLLILDNMEHLIEAVPSIGELLSAHPALKILVTSQVPLRISGESVFRLAPLMVDRGDGFGDRSPAVELFANRASGADPGFSLDDHLEDVTELVSLLGGLPLAVELAAARVNVLTPAQILERLQRDSSLLASRASDAPQRHRSLNDAMAWSYDLLSPSQQSVLRSFAVFRGGGTFAAIEEVSGRDVVDDLAELVDRSLVLSETASSGKRFDVLDSVRQFSALQLAEREETTGAEAHHSSFFVNLARSSADDLVGRHAARRLAALSDDHENFQSTLGRLLTSGDFERGFDIIGSIWRYYRGVGRLGEAALWLDRLFALPDSDTPSGPLVKALMARGAIAYWRGEFSQAVDDYRTAVQTAVAVGDPHLEAHAYFGLGSSLGNLRMFDEGNAALESARILYMQVNDQLGLADLLSAEALHLMFAEGIEPGLKQMREALAIYEDMEQFVMAGSLNLAIASASVLNGDFDEARRVAQHSIDLADRAGDRFVAAWAMEWVATAIVAQGNTETGGLLAGAAAEARDRMGGGWTPMNMDIQDARSRLVEILGETATKELMARGAKLSLDQAIELARSRETSIGLNRYTGRES